MSAVNPRDQHRSPDHHDGEEQLDAQLRAVERVVLRRFDPGMRGVVIAALLMLLIVCMALPWSGNAVGWQVLLDAESALERGARGGTTVLPMVFSVMLVVIGIALSALTLIMRSWRLAWVCTVGCWLSTVLGLLSIWSRQTAVGAPGPGVGVVLAAVAVGVLAVQWARIAFSRPDGPERG